MPDSLVVEMRLLGIERASREIAQFSRLIGGLERQNTSAVAESRVARMQSRATVESRPARMQSAPLPVADHDPASRVDRSAQADRGRIVRAVIDPLQHLLQEDRRAHSPQASGLKMVGDVAQVFGPYGEAIKATTDMLYLLDAAGRQADASLRSFQAMQYESGGTAREQAKAGVFADYLGMKPEGFTHLSRQFANTIATDPYAMHYANAVGIRDREGPNGTLAIFAQPPPE